ncbi:MAG: hypothetical protein ACLFRV_09085 [Acidimicrobiales bacterium]
MSWHPSRASTEALDPATPSRYRSAVVQCCAGSSMLVQTDDGDERLVPAPSTPAGSLVGSRVLLANDHDWVVAVDPGDPDEGVVIDLASGPTPPAIDLRVHAGRERPSQRRAYLFGRRQRRAG